MKFSFSKIQVVATISVAALFSCQKDDTATTTTSGTATVPTVFSSNFKSGVTLSATSTTVTMKSTGVPDHVSPYWGTGNTLYEAPTLTGQTVNPGTLQAQAFVMTIPTSPAEAAYKRSNFFRSNWYGA